jgi:hypothetical protein
MQFVRFITAGTLAALATAIALDADAKPPIQPRVVTAAQIEAAVDEAQAMADQVKAEAKARARAER